MVGCADFFAAGKVLKCCQFVFFIHYHESYLEKLHGMLPQHWYRGMLLKRAGSMTQVADVSISKVKETYNVS